MILLSLLACLDASADAPVRWEYARVQIFSLDCLGAEVGRADPAIVQGSSCLVDSTGATVHVHNVAEALDVFGDQGWELVILQGPDMLFKRRR